MKKIFFLIFFSFNVSLVLLAQGNYRIDTAALPWENNKDGYKYIDLPITKADASLPEEFKPLQYFSIFNVPFQIKPETAGKFATTTEGNETILLNTPIGTNEILFVMFADFPNEESGRSWNLPTPLTILNEPERAVIQLFYSDGETDEIIPVNADHKCYGITHGRSLYSVTAKKGKSIAKMVFADKMRNAFFQILAATANKKLLPRVALPNHHNLWYPAGKKVELMNASFSFDTTNGIAWKSIESEMLPEIMNLEAQPVFMFVVDSSRISSKEWNMSNVKTNADTNVYTLNYQKDRLNLQAIVKSFKSVRNEISMAMQVINKGTNSVNGQLFFPMLSNLKIGSAENTWFVDNRNASIISKVNCSFRDYLGSEKPLQFDGIFNPQSGVGLGIFTRDTTDFFRWYNFSKDDNGINYAIEYTPVIKKTGEVWKSIPVALRVIPGDWKEHFAIYKEWVSTWYRKSTPVLNWFKSVFAFAYYDSNPNGNHDFTRGAMEFKNRFGYLDYLHIFGWSNTNAFGHWGDYSHYESVGGKKEFAANIQKMQIQKNIPVGLYLDGYLITDQSQILSNHKKFEWAIKQKDGQPFRAYDSYVECLYVKGWRDYLVSRYKEVQKITGAKGMYCDELGMSLRSRVCYDSAHGHEVPMYMAQSENLLMREIKAALPQVAVYNEFGGTDVMTQFHDGGLTYLTSWNSYSPEWYDPTGNIPYNEIAPFYLDLRRFAFPDFKTFDVIMTQTPWKNGNWSLGKFPFFNGNSYFHRVDVGEDADTEAVEMFRKIRLIQNKYKKEFSSNDVEPMLTTFFPNTFVNRFSSSSASIYTAFNANFRTVKDFIFKVQHKDGVQYRNVWDNKPVTVKVEDGYDYLFFEITPRGIACIAAE